MRCLIQRLSGAIAAVFLLAGCATNDPRVPTARPDAGSELSRDAGEGGGFEVWVADQSDTRPGFGGTLHIFNGADLMGRDASKAEPITRLDLAWLREGVCAATGKNPVRPHMLRFNEAQTHAILSFVASGHVVIFDAVRREPLACFLTTQSPTGQQAHAAFAAPDGSYLLVANQSGKRLERIDTDYARNIFTHNPAATLDLATCTTPSGQPCEAADLRPVNWPICPIVDQSSTYGFVTLRGGGMFVIDARATPMRIVVAYDGATVKGNGCGGLQVDGHMYVNSGGSPVNVSGGDPHHPLLYGFDVYRFPVSGYSSENGPNLPAPERIFSKEGMHDSHGMVATRHDRYLWVMDRHADVVDVLDVASGKRVNTIDLNGALTTNAAPDLSDIAPAGNRVFVALRGPVPLSGDPHNATGSTPGLGVMQVTAGGRNGAMIAIVPLRNPNQQPGQQPDPHGVRVRRQ